MVYHGCLSYLLSILSNCKVGRRNLSVTIDCKPPLRRFTIYGVTKITHAAVERHEQNTHAYAQVLSVTSLPA